MPSGDVYTYTDSGTTAGTWMIWTTQGTATTANSGNYVLSFNGQLTWTNWATSVDNRTISIGRPYNPPVLTPEQQAAEQVRLEAAAQKFKKQQDDAKLADARADALLAEFLDAMQADQYDKETAFIVETDSGKRYELKRGKRVAELGPDGKPIALYCIHPTDWALPQPDVMLTQMLMLETDEASFLRIANRSEVR